MKLRFKMFAVYRHALALLRLHQAMASSTPHDLIVSPLSVFKTVLSSNEFFFSHADTFVHDALAMGYPAGPTQIDDDVKLRRSPETILDIVSHRLLQ